MLVALGSRRQPRQHTVKLYGAITLVYTLWGAQFAFNVFLFILGDSWEQQTCCLRFNVSMPSWAGFPVLPFSSPATIWDLVSKLKH